MSATGPSPLPFMSRAKRPWATHVILFINCAVFAVQWAYGKEGEQWVFENLAQERLKVWEGEYWRLFTAVFVQTMFVHLAFNMMAHVSLGRVMERVLGWRRFLVLYMIAGLGGSFAFQALSEGGHAVGASGAIYGVAGAFLLAAYGRTPSGEIVPGRRFLRTLLFIVVGDQVFAYLVEKTTLGMRIGVSAHLGGLLSGIALGYILTPRPPGIREASLKWRVAVACGLVAALGATGVYGCFYAIHEKDLRFRASQLELDKCIEERRFEAAVESWRDLPAEDENVKRELGNRLYDLLMAVGRDDLGAAVLNDLIHSAESALEDVARRGDPPADLLNEVAWYHALQGTDLAAALKLSEDAVRKAQAVSNGWLFKWLPRADAAVQAESMYTNTRGWIRLQLKDDAGAIEDLKAACELKPLGINYVYLALAHERLGHHKEALEAAEKAEQKDELPAYERRLLFEMKRN